MKLFKVVPAGYSAVFSDGEGRCFYDCYKVTGPFNLRAVQLKNMDKYEARALAAALNRAYKLGQKELE